MSHSRLPWMSGQTQVQTWGVKPRFSSPLLCLDLKEEVSITHQLAGVKESSSACAQPEQIMHLSAVCVFTDILESCVKCASVFATE